MEKADSITAQINKSRTISKIWLVPITAVAIGLWLLYQQWVNMGTLITIEFPSATGLEAYKTKIKTRDVHIGDVEGIRLKPSNDGVLVSARIRPEAEHLLARDGNFWVVSTRITHSGITGLNTLLSGAYIEFSPGMDGQQSTVFKGLTEPPVTPAGTPGAHITLSSQDKFAFNKGDPVIFKGLTVGQFEDVYFNFVERKVYYNAFINAPYHNLLTENTRFWNASGFQVDLSTDGISMQTGNLQTLMTNGVTFDLAENLPPGEKVDDKAHFVIYNDRAQAMAPRFQHAVHYVVLVSDTVRGLTPGAPVEYRGVTIGEVLQVNFHPPSTTNLFEQDYKIPVLISIEPGKIGLPDSTSGVEQIKAQNALWITQGLKARLQTGNLLTGKLFVDLQHYPNEPAEQQDYMGYPVIPTTLDDFSQLTQKAGALLDKFNRLPVEALTNELSQTLQTFQQTAEILNKAGTSLDSLLAQAEQQNLAGELNNTLLKVQKLLGDYSQGSASYQEFTDAMQSLDKLLRDIQPLLLQLRNKPNSLIFGDNSPVDIQPKAYKE